MYKIKLEWKYGNDYDSFLFELHENNEDEFFLDYKAVPSPNFIKNDLYYIITAVDEEDNTYPIERLYINDEFIDDYSFVCGRRFKNAFMECFGVVKIEAVIEGKSFVTDNIRILVRDIELNRNVANMIEYIYENCDDYLYEEHKNSKIQAGITQNEHVSIESKLSLIGEIFDTYVKCYDVLRYSPQTKPVRIAKVDDFGKIQQIRPNTVRYISCHPEELQAVNYSSGISVYRKYYQPAKTLVETASYSTDIYENRVIVYFIKRVYEDLKVMINDISARLNTHSVFKHDGYFESSYFIYSWNDKLLKNYLQKLDKLVFIFQELFFSYKSILRVSEVQVVSTPEFTNIFRCIAPYNAIFQNIDKWFKCGKYDVLKSNLLLSFITTSKIYEYYCLIKLNKAFEKNGFSREKSEAFRYQENKYYTNTLYNNTFKFAKNQVKATVYFQPVIYGIWKQVSRPNEIDLFRNTSISINPKNEIAQTNDEPFISNKYYTPDYIVKLSSNGKMLYFLLDAKFSTSYNVKKNQLPQLVYKYIFSVSTLAPSNASINGLCILCGKDTISERTSVYDYAKKLNISVSPEVDIINVPGAKTEDNQILDELVKQWIDAFEL